MLGFTVSPEELKVFIDELDEFLLRMESQILLLEKESSPAAIAELFRIAHTIKGGAASIGYEALARLSHRLESLLDGLRGKRLSVTPEIIDLLLRGLDALRTFKKNLREGKQTSVDIEVLEKALEPYTKKQTATSVSTQEFSSGESMYEVRIDIAPACDMPCVRAFQILLEMKKIGDIVDSVPSQESIEKGDSEAKELRVRLNTKSDPFDIKKTLERMSDVSRVALKKMAVEAPSESSTASSLELAEEFKSVRTLRVDIHLFDNLMDLAGELVIGKTRLLNVVGDLQRWGDAGFLGEAILNTTQQMSKITADLQAEVMKARLVPVGMMFSKFPRAVRDLAKRSNKDIQCVIEGSETQLDRSVLEAMIDPMIHLLRNAVDHGIESPDERKRAGKPSQGTIKISAFHRESHILITVQDDGRGIQLDKVKEKAINMGLLTASKLSVISEPEVLDFLFAPGFSTAENVTELSGRGVGLDIVKTNIHKIGGSIEVNTEAGKGTVFIFSIPLTLAILPGLKVKCRGNTFVLPLSGTGEIVKITAGDVKTIGGKKVIVLRDAVIPLVWLGELFREPYPASKETFHVVVVSSGEKQMGILVDQCLGNDDVVIKAIDAYVGELPGIAGATVLGDGTVALILDIPSLFQFIAKSRIG